MNMLVKFNIHVTVLILFTITNTNQFPGGHFIKVSPD